MTTNRSTILGLLAERRREIVARFGVKRVALFGSAAQRRMHQQLITLTKHFQNLRQTRGLLLPRLLSGQVSLC